VDIGLFAHRLADGSTGGNMRNYATKLALFALAVLIANPAFAGLAPSKTAENQSLEAREANLATIQQVISTEQVANALASHGFTAEQIDNRIAALSDEDLSSLAQNLDQIQAAGLTSSQWTYVLIGAVVVLVLLAI
jgi:hypothetical protein